MGKIRVKTLGNEEDELKQQEEARRKREEKIAQERAKAQANPATTDVEDVDTAVTTEEEKPTEAVKTVKRNAPTTHSGHSQSYLSVAAHVDKNKTYSVQEAVELLPKLKRAKFDETIELHINTSEPGISGSMTLPHGTGKQVKVAIATDALIQEVEKGTINFDVLLAEPAMMPKLAKVARILGPRGLMPNPKNGTVTPNPEEAAKKYAGGHVNFKTEAKLPVLHLAIGKVSFKPEQITENYNTAIQAVGKNKIKQVTLKSTMSPGIKVQL